ncbi:C1 family peptidase [Nocardia niigatensis]|uniref:C1 family peptidase n=1 Tax=Nocardia niigatensis TaxID=209249 RepID=UPI00030D8509|nr:C1 family peptidase [Nocardia niigatensis]
MKTISVKQNKQLGWIPDLPDQRDHLYAAPAEVLTQLPPSVDLTSQFGAVYDQGKLSSCTGNGIAGALQFDAIEQRIADESTPSRLFIYYNERVMEGTVDQDAGAMIRDGIKSVATLGACPETEWPYDISEFATEPPRQCFTDATKHRAIQYSRVAGTLSQMRGCLADGYPFVFGFTVYDSLFTPEVDKTGAIPLPGAMDRVEGGHCVVAVGYDDATSLFKIRNSWGPAWGLDGYGTIPYAYLLSVNASDFWTIRTVTS